MKIFKYLTVLCLLVLGLYAAPAADAAWSSNWNTGFGSRNVARVTQTNTTMVGAEENALVVNWVKTRSNTGWNSSWGNTVGGGESDTGDAESNTLMVNNVNSTLLDVDGCGCEEEGCECMGDKASNMNTGPCSTNTATVTETNTTVVGSEQNAAVVNVVSTESNTGGNTEGANTWQGGCFHFPCMPPMGGDGSSSDTGDATSNTHLENWVNNTQVYVNRDMDVMP